MSKVRLYGFKECPYCDELRALYSENSVQYDYVDINLEKYKDEVKKVMELGNTDAVPIILVNNSVILSPEVSFGTIKDAYLLTIKFLSQ
jgi:glutaredoxin